MRGIFFSRLSTYPCALEIHFQGRLLCGSPASSVGNKTNMRIWSLTLTHVTAMIYQSFWAIKSGLVLQTTCPGRNTVSQKLDKVSMIHRAKSPCFHMVLASSLNIAESVNTKNKHGGHTSCAVDIRGFHRV